MACAVGTLLLHAACDERRMLQAPLVKLACPEQVIRAMETMTKAARLEVKILDTLQNKRTAVGDKNCIRLLSEFSYRGHTCLVFEPMVRLCLAADHSALQQQVEKQPRHLLAWPWQHWLCPAAKPFQLVLLLSRQLAQQHPAHVEGICTQLTQLAMQALNLRELIRKYGRNIGLNLKVQPCSLPCLAVSGCLAAWLQPCYAAC